MGMGIEIKARRARSTLTFKKGFDAFAYVQDPVGSRSDRCPSQGSVLLSSDYRYEGWIPRRTSAPRSVTPYT